VRIKNINGTSDNDCKCGSWLRHWEKFSGQTTQWCQANGCIRTDVVGAHVQKATGSNSNWGIYPLCNEHNKHNGELEVSDSYKLVSANKKETCEK
jgi:hypothetical protein